MTCVGESELCTSGNRSYSCISYDTGWKRTNKAQLEWSYTDIR